MPMPLSPQIWNKAQLNDNRLLPQRYSLGLFTGKGVNIANNEEAYAYDDIIVSDRIFDYDDRRLNGLNAYQSGFNADGRDGWGASAYGPFQTVRFTRRVFTSGQHKSIAWRVFDEKQYTGNIGNWGDATKSAAYTGGEAYLSTAETINRAKKIWDAEILGPHIDKYNFFAIANGHIAGRFVQTNAGQGAMFDGTGTWVATPGPYPGMSYQPEFAPIKCVEWDAMNVRPLLNAIDVAWTNLFIPADNRVIMLDKAYKDTLLSNLIGIPGTMPHTDKAYDALVEGRFERFYGWDFDFSVPSQYFPKVYVDGNLNVVHSADASGAYDKVINSITATGMHKLQKELAGAARTRDTNYIGTYWEDGAFVNKITNYALSMPSGEAYYGTKDEWTETLTDWEVTGVIDSTANPTVVTRAKNQFPWQGYPGQGPHTTSGPQGSITQRQVIGMAIYRPAAQLGVEYGYMETARGGTRGKFTEMVFDVKHDAWVIPNLSHGILLILDSDETSNGPSIPVRVVNNVPGSTATIDAPANFSIAVGAQAIKVPTITNYDGNFGVISSDTTKVTVNEDGIVTGVATTGSDTVTLTYYLKGNPSVSDTCSVTVTA